MSLLERYRELYEYEKDCNHKMVAMIESVPEANRGDARFQQAINLANHLTACREFWLAGMAREDMNPGDPFAEERDLAALRPRFAAIETRWTEYLAKLDETALAADFELLDGGQSFRWRVEGQILQLAGHASYHRGQIALLVDQLGGETVDTDYRDWACSL